VVRLTYTVNSPSMSSLHSLVQQQQVLVEGSEMSMLLAEEAAVLEI